MNNVPVSLNSVVNQNILRELFDRHEREEAAIRKFSTFAEDHKDIIQYFVNDHGTHIKSLARDVFDYKRAKAELDADCWRSVINLSEVLQVMPAKARTELNDKINEKTIPFDKETVYLTINGLLAQRGSFLADKVAGIHQSLSGKHVTNSPMAFRTRMIISHALTVYKSGRYVSYDTNYKVCEIINDLRQVIAQLNGRDFKTQPSTQYDFRFIINQEAFGEWFHFDGGAFSVKIFKAGTAHFDVHPEIALKLNDVLATKYPNVIADSKGRKVKAEKAHVELRKDILSFEVINILLQASDDLRNNQTVYCYKHKEDAAWSEAEKVFEFIGGVKQKSGNWFFENDVLVVLKKIIMSGCLPEKVSHQFYPTKPDLAKRLVETADIGKNDMVLEPSAGHGGIAEFLPVKNNVHCIEVNPINCEILKTKGFGAVLEKDFLSIDEEKCTQFDRIVMNPPFHSGQAGQHVNHAAKMLKKKGSILVSVLPASYKGNEFCFQGTGVEVAWSEILEEQFDDTLVSVVIAKAVRVR